MDWIKKHYDQFALALLALVLLAFSVMLILRALSFADGFSAATAVAIPRDKVPPLVLDRVEEAQKALETPPQWAEPDSHQQGPNIPKKIGSLFVSDRYVVGKDGKPVKPDKEAFYNDSLTGQPIPNLWFIDNHLPLLDPTVPLQDPDGDGFPNEDEWRQQPGGPTDPNKKDSHPPYPSKLFVKLIERVPFRLLFNGYDGNPKTDKPEKFEFQINTIDLRQPSEFLKIGTNVTNTKFRLEKFEYKTQKNPNTGEDEDVSELTLINTETNEPVVLILNRVTDSPDYFVRFLYKWPNPPLEFRVKKLGKFGLKPLSTTPDYKLIDSKDGKAQIQTPDGKQIEILPDPRDSIAK